MSSRTHSFSFNFDADGWVFNANGGSDIVGARDATEDSSNDPISGTGTLQARRTGRNKSSGTPYWEWTGTWEQLGLPASAEVTAVNIAYDWKCSEFNVGNSSSFTGPMELRDSGGTLVHTFSTAETFGGTTSWATKSGTELTGLTDPAQTTIKLRVGTQPNTGNNNGAAVTLRQDFISVSITYTESDSPFQSEVQIPGGVFINETDTLQAQIPGAQYINETVAAGGAFSLDVDSGSYTITGTAATLQAGRQLAVDSGSYTITGTTASLEKGYQIGANSGSYTITGTAVDLTATRTIGANSGSFVITGQDATLTYTPNNAFSLDVDSGTFTITGTAVTLAKGSILIPDSGTFTITGQDATLQYERLDLSAESGTFTITGQDVTLTTARTLSVDSGSFTITGANAELEYSAAPPEVVAISGMSAARHTRRMRHR